MGYVMNYNLQAKEAKMQNFTEIRIEDFAENPFTMTSRDWMLISAEREGTVNTMTASWGMLGHLWAKNTACFVIRPHRYTKEFVDAAERVSLSVLPESFRDTLNYLGTVSGRDEDKIGKRGLTVEHENGVPYFAQARLVFICRKLFSQPFLEDSFIDKSIASACYPQKDFHVMYVAEIEGIWERNH
jgi:flavin reductase (DIM6/NTAB) family NADH-FMN oxidoreductase RutF